MEDKENNSFYMDDIYSQDNTNKNNTLVNDIKNFSELNHQLSAIKNNSTNQMSSIETIIDMLNDTKIPYPNADEIPLIKLIDKNYFEKDIDNYILVKFDDNKFNICRICNKIQNKFFCKNCNKNICEICYSNCITNKHSLIELKKFIDLVKENKKNIDLIISNNFISPKEKKNPDGIEKKNNNNEIMNEFEMNNDIEGKLNEYTNDIIFIKAIIDKNYINYFHYINIKECLIYLRKKYDYITINYKINNKKIQIFGEDFVKNNKNICQIIYENKSLELTQFLELKNIGNKEILEIKLIGINNIIDASCMFWGCISLISLPDISKWNTINVTNIGSLFNQCKSLALLPDISKWNTKKVTNIREMFNGCTSLISLPDISNWNTKNVIDMGSIFSWCKSLISLPDISKWDTSKVTNMSNMFNGCYSLKSLPDISKWNTINVTNMSDMFWGCKSLISLPDISNWNTNNVKKMNNIFSSCIFLNSLPDISKWNISNLIEMNGMFYECKSFKMVGNKNFSDFKIDWDKKFFKIKK